MPIIFVCPISPTVGGMSSVCEDSLSSDFVPEVSVECVRLSVIYVCLSRTFLSIMCACPVLLSVLGVSTVYFSTYACLSSICLS
jgi:hypothetical protein